MTSTLNRDSFELLGIKLDIVALAYLVAPSSSNRGVTVARDISPGETQAVTHFLL
jgi:hypothetical protein